MTMQRHELEAWLGDDHGLTEKQVNELLRQADEIEERYPDRDDQAERSQALTTAYALMSSDADTVVSVLARHRSEARAAEATASAGLQQAAIALIGRGDETEAGFARKANVDRMTVRKWLGK